MAKTFEDNMNSLEEIARELEDGNLSLDESFKKYKDGIELVKKCSEKLKATEKQIKILKDDNGVMTEEDFE